MARDYLADVIHRFERFIERIFAGDIPNEEVDLDNFFDAGEHYLMPTVEIIIAIHAATRSEYLPSPSTVARWADQYWLKAAPLLQQIDPVGYEKFYLVERRPVITATFDRLLQMSRALYPEDELPANSR
jgi:hypothetical protein